MFIKAMILTSDYKWQRGLINVNFYSRIEPTKYTVDDEDKDLEDAKKVDGQELMFFVEPTKGKKGEDLGIWCKIPEPGVVATLEAMGLLITPTKPKVDNAS